jgi:hypothetical protein
MDPRHVTFIPIIKLDNIFLIKLSFFEFLILPNVPLLLEFLTLPSCLGDFVDSASGIFLRNNRSGKSADNELSTPLPLFF